MILTNRLGLPRSIERAVANDPYSRGDAHISVTSMIGPARKRAIELEHAHEITEDVADRIWSLLGQVTHGILQRADDEGWCEERLFIERHGWRISGSFDRYVLLDGLLQDYKLTSTYTTKAGAKTEWIAQENLYALMLREHGYEVNRLEVVALLRDWSRAKARHAPTYPQQPVELLPVDMWPAKTTEQYIRDRLLAHGKAQTKLPLCTPEERWESETVWALHKDRSGTGRATSLHKTHADAELAIAGLKQPGLRIVERPPEQRRCAEYCTALPWCEQGQELIKATEEFRLSKMWAVTKATTVAG